MKPWAKYEQNFINHPKFLALPFQGICLWIEGKSYCDEHHTDGFIPKVALKNFRAYTKRLCDVLLQSIGKKPTGEPWAPLWEEHPDMPTYLHMHDYLEYNDCRDAVLDRIDQADQNRALDREYKQRAREAKKAKRPVSSGFVRSDIGPDSDRTRTGSSGSIQKQQQYQKHKEQEQKTAPLPPDGRSKRPLFTGQRLTVFEWQLDDCMRTLGAYADDFDLHAWFYAVDARLVADGLVIPKRDGGEWLQAQLIDEAQRRGLALKLATVTKPGATVELSNEAILAEIRRQDERVRRQ